MPTRAATTSDTFNAIAEPRRRDILDYLAARERSVGDSLRAEINAGLPMEVGRTVPLATAEGAKLPLKASISREDSSLASRWI